jgi:hypothetical protein
MGRSNTRDASTRHVSGVTAGSDGKVPRLVASCFSLLASCPMACHCRNSPSHIAFPHVTTPQRVVGRSGRPGRIPVAPGDINLWCHSPPIRGVVRSATPPSFPTAPSPGSRRHGIGRPQRSLRLGVPCRPSRSGSDGALDRVATPPEGGCQDLLASADHWDCPVASFFPAFGASASAAGRRSRLP